MLPTRLACAAKEGPHVATWVAKWVPKDSKDRIRGFPILMKAGGNLFGGGMNEVETEDVEGLPRRGGTCG